MANTKVTKTFYDFQKEIAVIEWSLLNNNRPDDLDIHYDFAGKEFNLIAPIEWACKALQFLGEIEDYSFENDTHWVRVEIEVESLDVTKRIWIEFASFLSSFTFSQADAIKIAAYHEGEKQLQQLLKGGNP